MSRKIKKHPLRHRATVHPVKLLLLHDVTNPAPSVYANRRRRLVSAATTANRTRNALSGST